MDTKLKADIAEYAVMTELLKRGFRVLKPLGDRLPYDVAVEVERRLIRLQVKRAWYEPRKGLFTVDSRRTKTNRRHMQRGRYGKDDFDFAILCIVERSVFYVMPFEVFASYHSGISLVEDSKRQRKPRSAFYRERWELFSS